MKFAVHTDKGVFHVDAANPKEARALVEAEHEAQASKVKVAGNQPRKREG